MKKLYAVFVCSVLFVGCGPKPYPPIPLSEDEELGRMWEIERERIVQINKQDGW